MKLWLGFLAFSSVSVLAIALPEDVAVFSYSGPSSIQGRFDGTCEAAGIHFPDVQSGHIELSAESLELFIRKTRVNYTTIFPDSDPRSFAEPEGQWSTPVELAEHKVRAEWEVGGVVVAFPAGKLEDRGGSFDVELAADDLDAWAVEGSIRSSATFYWKETPTGIVRDGAGFVGPAKRIRFEGAGEAVGDFSVYLREATLVSADERTVLPPFRVVDSNVSSPAVSREVVTFNDAFLFARGASWAVPESAEVACAGLQGDVTGGAVFDDAIGNAEVAGRTVSFSEKVLTVEGNFRLEESADGADAAGGRATQAEARGKISRLGEDFFVVAGAKTEFPAKETGLVVLILAAIALLAKNLGNLVGIFYSRLDGERVLNNPNREMILNAVRASPGTDLSDLCKSTTFHISTVAYHVQVLSRVGLVRAFRDGRSVRVVPKEMNTRRGVAKVLSSKDEHLAYLAASVVAPTPIRDVVRSLMERFSLPERQAYRTVDRAVKVHVLEKLGSRRGAMVKCAS